MQLLFVVGRHCARAAKGCFKVTDGLLEGCPLESKLFCCILRWCPSVRFEALHSESTGASMIIPGLKAEAFSIGNSMVLPSSMRG
jgi:hypothetical protein